jgi:hypothetical protein
MRVLTALPSHPRRLFAALVILAVFVATSAATSGEARADKKSDSIEHFDKGKTHYDLGRFDEAVAEFEKAYELYQDAVYLFNIAQAHRQKGDAVKAIFFYKRFLAADPQNPKRANVEKRIKELEEIAKKQEENRQKPPEDVSKPGDPEKPDTNPDKPQPDKTKPKTKPERVASADDDEDPDADDHSAPPDDDTTTISSGFNAPDHVFRIGAEVGPGFVGLGDGPSVPVQVSVRGAAAYSLSFNKLAIDLGAAATYTPIPYELGDGTSATSSLVGLMGNAAGRYHATRHIDVRAELGAGAQWWSGLQMGNRFTDMGLAASGPLPMFVVRLALGVDYVLDSGLIISATPVSYQYSPPHEGLDDAINSVTQFDLLLGLGYAL